MLVNPAHAALNEHENHVFVREAALHLRHAL
jgi:hypothetical protein